MVTVLALIVAYTGYWFILADRMQTEAELRIEAYRDQGLEITYDALSVSGFPYRLELVIENLKLGVSGDAEIFSMRSPKVLFETLPWKPNHVLAIMPVAKVYSDPAHMGAIEASINESKASIKFGLNGSPKRISTVAETVNWHFVDKPDFVSTAGHSEFHYRKSKKSKQESEALEEDPDAPMLGEFAIKLTDIDLADIPVTPYGSIINILQSQIELKGDVLPGRNISQMIRWRDSGGTLEVVDFLLNWGELDAKVSGTLALDEEMRPLGAFVLKVKGYEPLIDYLQAHGHIDGEMAANTKATLGMVAGEANTTDAGRISIPVTMQGGRLFVGPLPVDRLEPITKYLLQEEDLENAPDASPLPEAGAVNPDGSLSAEPAPAEPAPETP